MNDTITLTREEVREAGERTLKRRTYACLLNWRPAACVYWSKDPQCYLCKCLTEFASQGDPMGKGEEDE